jgi:ABC-type oligopeptide transport system ATPase subunit
MKCRIRKPNSQKALETMRENHPDVSDKILSLIAGYGQTIVEEAPNRPGVTSNLYNKWLELMGNEA